MKLIIDISEEFYEHICGLSTIEPYMRISDIIRKREHISSKLMKAIVNGEVVPDDVNKLQEQLRKARKKAKRWKRKYLELRYKLDEAGSEDTSNLCNKCNNERCVMQPGICRNDCEFFIAKGSEKICEP